VRTETYYAVCNRDRKRWVGRHAVVTSLRNAFWYEDKNKAIIKASRQDLGQVATIVVTYQDVTDVTLTTNCKSVD